MRLSWNEVRARASNFAREWSDASYEKGESQSFYNEFFEVFGVRRRSVAYYERQIEKLDKGRQYIDLFWPSVLLVEQKSAGRDLTKASTQADEYFGALPENERPQYILVSDFQTFRLRDLDKDAEYTFRLSEFPEHVKKFGFILGVQKREFRDQDPVNIKAAETLGRLHDALAAQRYKGHDLERFLVRVVFCLFADDTGVFESRDLLLEFLETRTSEDGSDLGARLIELFQVLNTPEGERLDDRDEDLKSFPYVNGDLFSEPLRIPAFNSSMRKMLIDACQFDWSRISPAIFGALFQSVMNPKERRQKGAHYTTEQNILKVIEPLFMDDLRAEFEKLKSRRGGGRRVALQRFQEKLAGLKFFDPACGCGNFLVIAYREIRRLEHLVIRELTALGELGFSQVNVDQFFGIEVEEFPARIAETAMWMMDHIMNNELTVEIGENCARIPLTTSARIVHGDALEIEWPDVLPAEECSFVFGNPPFGGAKYQTEHQRGQVRRIAALGGSGGTLDFVTPWYIKAGEYVQKGQTRIGFVSTNSIAQGEQVAQLWPILFDRFGLEISFAHRTFAWGSDARGRAHVHVIIVGLDRHENARNKKRLFSYPNPNGAPEESLHKALSPYLFDASGVGNPRLTVRKASKPINGIGKLVAGSKPIDGGWYIFDKEKRDAFLETEPDAAKFLRPFVGALEFLQGGERWILALQNARPEELAQLPHLRHRIGEVRRYRSGRESASTRALAESPTRYHLNVLPDATFLVIPKVSSERRRYVPVGWLEPPTIPSDLLLVLQDASIRDFALLTSAMHMAWLRHVGGRLESRYRYSVGMVYNTFPLPPREADLAKLEPLANAVLDARAEHPNATLANLYDPDLMPANLVGAHRDLDRAVDRLYRKSGFKSERERVEHLFALYEKMIAPLQLYAKKKPLRTETGSS